MHRRQKRFSWAMYAQGWGVNSDDHESCSTIPTCHAAGDAPAQRLCGLMYAEGQGVEHDDREAIRLYPTCRRAGDTMALCTFLGLMYAQGRGVEVNDAQAVQLSVGRRGWGCRAQDNLGSCTNKDKASRSMMLEAARLYRLAADRRDAPAQCNLGFMYAEGRGVSS